MKQVIIFHGYGENPGYYWYPYLKKELGKRGYEVKIPALPNTDDPRLAEQLEFTLNNLTFTKDTILIGHSSGCPLILAILEKINTKMKQVILVAGYTTPLKVDPENTKNIKERFNWQEIKKHCSEFIFINSDNDP